ncbi:hypothetical protein BC936DRAFT_138979 [Jimgerdemannia flammicorona]|uniref:Uncharacterized protein n=1 Tax=Jimgerdemannia flammicorona TaxID=994334 RepID=A0A433BBF8_9FUNG|nr:hypothetical protein BC936DRAFT_138979 [Jimgerdemannia flammicorona]
MKWHEDHTIDQLNPDRFNIQKDWPQDDRCDDGAGITCLFVSHPFSSPEISRLSLPSSISFLDLFIHSISTSSVPSSTRDVQKNFIPPRKKRNSRNPNQINPATV